MKRTFWSYAASIFAVSFALMVLFQLNEFQKVDLMFAIPFAAMLAVLGGGIGALAVSTVRRKEEEIAPYQIANEPETKGIFRFVFVGENLQFKSEAPPEIAVERLKNNVVETPLVFRNFSDNAVIGKVSVNRVKLIYARANFRNSFNPIFIGKFRPDGNGSVLYGVYRLHRIVTAFLCVWFGVLAFGSGIAVTTIIADSKGRFFTTPACTGALLFLIFPLLMGAAGLGLVAFGKRIARASLHHLSEVIEKSIGVKSL